MGGMPLPHPMSSCLLLLAFVFERIASMLFLLRRETRTICSWALPGRSFLYKRRGISLAAHVELPDPLLGGIPEPRALLSHRG